MFSLSKISKSPAGSFLWFLIWFILGVAVASAADLPRTRLFEIYLALIILAAVLILFWQKKEIRLLILGGIFLFLGIGRFVLSEPPVDARHLRFYHGRLVEIEGVIVEEPIEKSGKQTIVAASQKLKVVNGASPYFKEQTISGRAILYLPAYPQYGYGDQLKITCVLEAPEKKEGSNYPAVLARQGVWSICQLPRVDKIGERKGNRFMAVMLAAKTALSNRLNQILPEPQASFLGGLLYGARAAIPADLQNAFTRTGVSHIVAISGYNITIIVTALAALLRGLWIPRPKAFWLTIGGLIFFVLFTGASASVVRAGVMGVIALLARQSGRLSQIGRLLILTAFLMLLANPRTLFFDAGFQLSFSATLGLIYLSPLLERWTHSWPAFFGLKEILLTTFSAIIATLPLILYQFGRFSLIAPLVNILILPVIPLTMALGFAALTASFVFGPLGQVLAWLAWLPLTYQIKIVEFFSQWQWASFLLPKLPWWLMAAMYGGMIVVIMSFPRKRESSDKLLTGSPLSRG